MRKKNFKREDYGGKLIAVVFADQIRPGSFEHAQGHLLDRIDLSGFEARYRNEAVGASAYHPRVLVKTALLAYARGVTKGESISFVGRQESAGSTLRGLVERGHVHELQHRMRARGRRSLDS